MRKGFRPFSTQHLINCGQLQTSYHFRLPWSTPPRASFFAILKWPKGGGVLAGWTMGVGPAHGFPKNSVGRPRPFLYGPAHLPLVGPKNWLGRPIGPFDGWDPWHQPSPKTAFLGPFLGCFAHSMVILEALSQGFFSMHSWPISRHFSF